MRFSTRVSLQLVSILSLLLLWQFAGMALDDAHASGVLRVPDDFTTIQEAVDAAQPGDTIKVSHGTFSEHVTISNKSDIRLQGRKTLLDGSGVGNGDIIGIHIVDSDHIRVHGFIIEGFDAGIVLEKTEHSWVHNIETRFNDSDTSSLRDGLQLVASHYNLITNVYAHHNGHNGVTLKGGSSNNTLGRIIANDNGQNPAVGANFGGCGIQLISSDNDDNTIVVNTTRRNGWGIQVGGGSDGNKVLLNRSHENQRAGVVVLAPGADNLIALNNATGNGLADVPPSGTFGLFDQGDLDNTWIKNKGTSNF